MKKVCLVIGVLLCFKSIVWSHCQMPCGIYHDDMVFSQIDQYVETMFKGNSVLGENKFSTLKDKNELVRWIILKENASDGMANLMTSYFLQQKIKPGEEDTSAKLISAHRLLVLLVQIKQNVDQKFVDSFADEWEKFKNMFHVEGYECQIEILKRKREEAKKKSKQEEAAQHDHDHNHPHEH